MKRALAALVFVACGGDDGVSTGGDAAHGFCVSETNRYRQTIGKVALVHSPEIEAYADEGAEIDFHGSPHQHFTSTNGGNGIAFAENECPGQLGWTLAAGEDVSAVVGRCIKAFYDEGPGGGHYENLMGPYTKVGCGIFAAEGKITIVQDLGN
jgi:hypothetical protein